MRRLYAGDYLAVDGTALLRTMSCPSDKHNRLQLRNRRPSQYLARGELSHRGTARGVGISPRRYAVR